MKPNDIIRKIRFALDLNDDNMMKMFELGGTPVSRAEVCDWLKRDEDSDMQAISDRLLAVFLNGLIIRRRGAKDGVIPDPENKLNNNIVFRKLRIALDLRDDDILEILEASGIRIGKSELGAFFRNPAHAKYRRCEDQILRNFLNGLSRFKI